jgi:mannose-6-phosphate isomerase-like protein (cupin superfamily)
VNSEMDFTEGSPMVTTAQVETFVDVPCQLMDERYVDMLQVPSGHMPPLHVHHSHDEIFYVLAGEVRFVTSDTDVVVRAGDTVRAPMGVPHAYRVEGDRPARWIVWSDPRGFERFVAEVAEHDEPSPQLLAEIGAKYDIEILGPPGTLPA